MKMKFMLALLVVPCYTFAGLDETALLERAISCKLSDQEIPNLIQNLESAQPALKKPYLMYSAPTANVYRLPTKLVALGYQSSEIVITSGRILLAVPEQTVDGAVQALNLELLDADLFPASRDVRPTATIVAFQLISHEHLKGKLLVGCQYASSAALSWPLKSDIK